MTAWSAVTRATAGASAPGRSVTRAPWVVSTRRWTTDPCTDDGLFCTGPEQCQGGVCVSAGNPCAVPADCDETNDVCGACGDGMVGAGEDCDPAAPQNDNCCDVVSCTWVSAGNVDPQGICAGAPECQVDACDGTGGCTTVAAPNGTPCGDSSNTECTNPDTCGTGTCRQNHEPSGAVCGDQGVECHLDDACDGAGGCTDNGYLANGTECGSRYCGGGNYRMHTCSSGSCSGSALIEACDPNESCIVGTGCRCGDSGLNCSGADNNYCCTNPPDGCYNINNNADHCGYGCEDCGQNMGCSNKNCVCHTDYGDCTGADGCETYLVDNDTHCGACNNTCGQHSSCVGTSCQCDYWYLQNCNGDWGDGCETDTCSDSNCGNCFGMNCTLGGPPHGYACVFFDGWCDCGCYGDEDCPGDWYCGPGNECRPLP